MNEPEQNERINELRRDRERVRQELHGLKADMEPDGHISESIGNLSEDVDSLEKVDKIYERLSHQIDRREGKKSCCKY